FVSAALQPAEVSRILIDEANGAMEIIVPDDQLSLAIGRRGQNVRLAAQLTGWKLDINSESRVREMREFAQRSLSQLPGMTDTLVEVLYRSEEHTSELQSRENLVCRLLLEKKKIPVELQLTQYYVS